VFNSKGIFVPVKYYECISDTGDSRPKAVIEQITNGQWLFQFLLAPKPHQQIVYIIEDFVWRFCEDYIPLNGVTQAEFGSRAWMWKSDCR
jgi:hypothetical protein